MSLDIALGKAIEIWAAPGIIAVLLGILSYFIPKPKDFSKDYEDVSEIILRKRSQALEEFVQTLTSTAPSFLEQEEKFHGRELFLSLDKYGKYKERVCAIKEMLYSWVSQLPIFLVVMAVVLGAPVIIEDRAIKVVVFLIGVIFLCFFLYRLRRFLSLSRELNDYKSHEDFK